jgi:hypothetical protein
LGVVDFIVVDLWLGRFANIQRDAGHEVAECMVETGGLGVVGTAVDVADQFN